MNETQLVNIYDEILNVINAINIAFDNNQTPETLIEAIDRIKFEMRNELGCFPSAFPCLTKRAKNMLLLLMENISDVANIYKFVDPLD